MPEPRTFSEQYKILDQFDSTYWSGLDMRLYVHHPEAGSLLVDELVQLNFQALEQVVPYYAYNSYIPDRMIHGSRIIQGEITVNYKKDSYPFAILQFLKTGVPKLEDQLNRIGEQATQLLANDFYPHLIQMTTGLPDIGSHQAIIDDETRQVNQDPASGTFVSEPVTREERSRSLLKLIATYNSDRENAINEIRDKVLNKIGGNVSDNVGMFQTVPGGFDMTVTVGSEFQTAQVLRYDFDNKYVTDPLVGSFPVGMHPGGGMQFIGVSLMGLARNQDDTGRNFVETYTFLAKTMRPISGEEISGYTE